MTAAEAFASRHQPHITTTNGAIIIFGLLTIRWIAGILENVGLTSLSEIAAVTMLAGLLVLHLHRMRLASATALFCAGLLLWIVSGALSYAANFDANAHATIALLSLLMLYATFANAAATYLTGPTGLAWMSRFLTAFIAFGCALSLSQIATGTGFVETGPHGFQRAFGSDVHPVSFAIQILAALVALEIARLKRVLPVTFAFKCTFILGSIALYLTFARTAWVMAALILGSRIVLRGSLARRVIAAGVVTTASIAILATSGRFTDLGSLPFFLESFSISNAVFDWRYVDNSVSWRIVNWSYGLQQALEQPLLGFGPGQSAVSSYFNLEMHNIFLEVFFEGGVLGLFALLITLTGLWRMHKHLPAATPGDRSASALTNSFGITLLLAVTLSTSFVDQLMSFLLYLLLLTAASCPTQYTPNHGPCCKY
ncbi:MAG: O-antigen ligase family protein [Paracoccaceae bacterium]